MSSTVQDESSNPRERLIQARRALVRGSIVGAALREFADFGYENAKVNDIAKRAGVSLAAFYAAFPSKWEVFRALHSEMLDALLREVGERVIAAHDAFDRLRFGLEGYLRFHIQHPDFLRVQLRERVPWGTTDELRTPEQTRAWETGLVMLTAAFRQAMDDGLLVEDDAELCARTATAMGQVRLAVWISNHMRESADAVADSANRQIVRTFARPERVIELLVRLDR